MSTYRLPCTVDKSGLRCKIYKELQGNLGRQRLELFQCLSCLPLPVRMCVCALGYFCACDMLECVRVYLWQQLELL